MTVPETLEGPSTPLVIDNPDQIQQKSIQDEHQKRTSKKNFLLSLYDLKILLTIYQCWGHFCWDTRYCGISLSLRVSGKKRPRKQSSGRGKKKTPTQWPCPKCTKNVLHGGICCDTCNLWYHFDCVGVVENQVPEDEDWHCGECQ